MPGRVVLPLLVVSALLVVPAGGQDDEGDALLEALQKKVDRAIGQARPSLARIYVSRSHAYAAAPYWGEVGGNPAAGELGRFDAEAARKRVPAGARNRTGVLQAIAEHDLSDPRVVPESYGSGLVVGQGLVLTCAHVVRDATRVYVRLPGKGGSWADVHAADPRSDLAVLRLLDAPAGMRPVPLGKGEGVRRGQFIIAAANVFAPRFRDSDEPIAGHGTITALRRKAPSKDAQMEPSRKKLHEYGTLLQIDARMTPGCSGGVLLDLEGKPIGLTTALAAIAGARPAAWEGRLPPGRGIRNEWPASEAGFAIPFDINTRRIIEVLKRGEEVEYGFLGVVLLRGLNGVALERVMAGSPAARAGLRAGDVLRSIDGKEVTHNDDLFLHVGMALAGNSVRIEAVRGNTVRTFTVKLAKYHVPGPVIAARRPAARFGLRVDYNSVLTQRNQLLLRWPPDGVAIREVVPGSPADKARLQPDKIITEVNGRAVFSPAEYYQAVARAGTRVEITFLTSDGRPESLSLEEK